MINTSAEFDSIAPDDALFLEAIYRYEVSVDQKSPISLEQLCREYPDVASKIREYFTDKGVMSGLNEHARFELCDTQRYQIVEYLNSGGMGAIARARDKQFDRLVVLKVPLVHVETDQQLLRKMEFEAELSGRLQHPNILPIYEKGKIKTKDEREIPYFAMRYLAGSDLEQMLDSRTRPHEDQLQYLLLFQQVCRAVAYAHSMRIANGDLKPKNIMVGQYDDAYVIDWGAARSLDDPASTVDSYGPLKLAPINRLPKEPFPPESLSTVLAWLREQKQSCQRTSYSREQFTLRIGTEAYLAPEKRTQQKVDEKRVDVFLLGGILAKILTGQPTYAGQKWLEQSFLGDLSGVYARIQNCRADRELKSLALRCLDADPQRRPVDAIEVEQAITRYVAKQEEAKIAAEKQLRNWVLLASVALIAGVVAFFQWRYIDGQNRQFRDYFESGSNALNSGNLQEANKQYSKALAIYPTAIAAQIKLLRTNLARQSRQDSLKQVESLLQQSNRPEERAELQFVQGDLFACDPDTIADAQVALGAALKSNLLSPADAFYARAVMSDSILQCDKNLSQALAQQPFHYRAATLRPAVLLAAGKVTDAERTAALYLQVFPGSIELQSVMAASQRLATDRSDSELPLPPFFDHRLENLRLAFAGDPQADAESSTHTLTFARQGKVASSAAAFIRSLPQLSQQPGLPCEVFLARSRFWDKSAKLATTLGAPQDLLDVANQLFAKREDTLKSLGTLAGDDEDGLSSQMLALANFLIVANNYNRWSKNDPERLKGTLIEIARLQTASINQATIAPRRQFDIASRVIRHLVNTQLVEAHSYEKDTRSATVAEDLDTILLQLGKYPGFIDDVCDLLTQTHIEIANLNKDKLTAENLTNRLRIANFWIDAKPGNYRPYLYRARVWLLLSQKERALADIQQVLDRDPEQKNALSMREEARASK